MGFDLYARNGGGFRVNMSGWPGVWNAVCDLTGDVLTEQQRDTGRFNGGTIVSEAQAIVIGKAFREALLAGLFDPDADEKAGDGILNLPRAIADGPEDERQEWIKVEVGKLMDAARARFGNGEFCSPELAGDFSEWLFECGGFLIG